MKNRLKKLLVVAAHPDDDILGCGGFLSKNKKNLEVRVIFIAEGSSCRFKDLKKEEKSIKAEIKIRNSYAREALGVLGVSNMEFYNLPCGRLDTVPLIEINKIIEEEIDIFKPDLIMSHSEHDVNNDHRTIYNSILMATRPGTNNCLKSILSFEILSSSEWNFGHPFTPNYFEPLELSHIEEKWQALECFKSEIRDYPHPRSKKGVLTLASYRGIQSGNNFAESFKIVREFS